MRTNAGVPESAEAAVFAAGFEYAIAQQRGPHSRDSHRQCGFSHRREGYCFLRGEPEQRGIRLPRLGRSGKAPKTRLDVPPGDRRDPRRLGHGKLAQHRATRFAAGGDFHLREIAARGGGIERQAGGCNRPGVFAPAHQDGDLVGLRQAVHPAFQAILVAMLARTKIVAGANPYPA